MKNLKGLVHTFIVFTERDDRSSSKAIYSSIFAVSWGDGAALEKTVSAQC